MSLETLIQEFGLPGIVAGTVAEGGTVAFMGGVVAHRGLLPLGWVVLAAALGAALVDNLMFLIGRHAGQRAFVQRQLRRGPVQALRDRLERYPVPAIIGFRFVYGMKSIGAILIGTTRTGWLRFAVLDAVGVLAWALTMVGLGYGAGTAIAAVFGRLKLHWHLAIAVAVFLVAVAVLGMIVYRRRKQAGEQQ
ncbi:VTT domain-containing protein [Rhodobacteraceae bacterium F11138]|nr:VTT domain-containing protein [Rhodobacteraceae bacterium F11138]